jgi:hypothetical protein
VQYAEQILDDSSVNGEDTNIYIKHNKFPRRTNNSNLQVDVINQPHGGAHSQMPSVNSKAKSKSLGRIGANENNNPAAIRSHDNNREMR